MPYTFEIQDKGDYLLLTASGTLDSIDELVSVGRSMRKKAAQCECRRFLIDERAVDKTIDPHDITVFAEARVENPAGWLRVAVVCSPENLPGLRWVETFFQNRSLPYRQFPSLQEAEEWLLSSRP